jgi:methanethiol S-methyltransferase
VIDVLLLALFAVQHTAMARPAFKRRWTRIVPAHVERSTFVLAATAVLALVFWQWRPIPAVVWQVDAGPARFMLWAVFAAGWARS